MSATNSRLSLDSYYLTELNYAIQDRLDTNPERVALVEPVNLEVSDTTTLLDSDTRTWRCELTIGSAESETSKDDFYSFKIKTVGFFRVDPSISVEQMTLLAETNCPAVLYSTSREIIATITRRSPYPPLLLPLVTFIKLPEKPTPASAKKKGIKPKAGARKPKS